jgi:hypothetical protein
MPANPRTRKTIFKLINDDVVEADVALEPCMSALYWYLMIRSELPLTWVAFDSSNL